ncbi:spore coat U domain-containing protein [Novosphingobium sp. BL-8A]|uniref:Csu type fimbrial protein n=1 Tax=Novosphingobium sp. BL-8A TaxID=3127639 RepID=UPI00375768F8
MPSSLRVIAAFAAACAPLRLHAATTAQFDVTATITPGCLVDGLGTSGNAGQFGTLDFGTDSTFATRQHTATTTASQTVRLRCTPGVTLSMTVDGGAHASSGQRNLQQSTTTTARVPYALCRDAACTLPIAIGTPVTTTIATTNSEDVRLPLYASLTLPGTLPPGTYTDTLTVTLTW